MSIIILRLMIRLQHLHSESVVICRTRLTFTEPEKVPAALINVAKHVSSLKFSLWEKMQALVEYSKLLHALAGSRLHSSAITDKIISLKMETVHI